MDNGTLKQIVDIISLEEYDVYGLRADDYQYNVGDTCNNSHELFQDPMFDENDELVYPEGEGPYEGYYDAGEINGTSAVLVEDTECISAALGTLKDYSGRHVYLIAGNCGTCGNDIGEVIIRSARVLAII